MSDGPLPGSILEINGSPHFLAWTYHDPDYIAELDPLTFATVMQHYIGNGVIQIMPFISPEDMEIEVEFEEDEE